MQEFRLKHGVGKHFHRGANRKSILIEAGTIVESETDLCERFPNKFERVSQTEGEEVKRVREGEEEADDEMPDVTEDFESEIGDKGLTVSKDGRRYRLYDSEGEELTEEAVTKKTLTALIEDYGSEDE